MLDTAFPEDRLRADAFEIELRRKADLNPRNSWELVWFLQLPLEIRCSYRRLLEARIDQESARRSLARQSCYQQSNWRCPTVACMVLETVVGQAKPWASLGRRERRKPTKQTRSTPRSRNQSSRQTTTSKAPPSNSKRKATRQATSRKLPPVGSSSVDVGTTPKRPGTPQGLREKLMEDCQLLASALGYQPDTFEKALASPPVPLQVPKGVSYKPFPSVFEFLDKPPLVVEGKTINVLTAYMAAAGRYQVAPWRNYGLEMAAQELYDLEEDCSGIFGRLLKALYPTGLNDVTMVEKVANNRDVLMDLVRGMVIFNEAKALKLQMPVPEPCSCGGNGQIYSF